MAQAKQEKVYMKKIKEIYIITLILIIIGVTTSFGAAGTVNTNGVRMRKAPSIDAEIVTNLHNGNSVEIIEKDGEWYKIKYNKQEGYIHSNYIFTNEKIEDNNAGEAKIEVNVSETPVIDVDNNLMVQEESTYPKTIVTNTQSKLYIMPLLGSTVLTEIETR